MRCRDVLSGAAFWALKARLASQLGCVTIVSSNSMPRASPRRRALSSASCIDLRRGASTSRQARGLNDSTSFSIARKFIPKISPWMLE